MSGGLATTFRYLTKTDNAAALGVLLPALDSPSSAVQEGALAAILGRRHPGGVPEILHRLDRLTEGQQEIIRRNPGRMSRALRDALLSDDLDLCRLGCRATLAFREYEMVSTLLGVLEADKPGAALARETLGALVGLLYEELAGPRDYHYRRDPQSTRRYVVSQLEVSLKRFGRHKRREVIEAFLLLATRDNVVLKNILQNPYHPAFVAVVETLAHSPSGGVLRLLLSFLDDPHAPSAAISVVGNRNDARFVRHLLHKVGGESSAVVAQNLARIETVGWLRGETTLLDELDETSQQGAMRLVIHAGIPRDQAFAAVEHVLLKGKVAARREAALALTKFQGADANALALRALDDADPQVQANVVSQLRSRSIPGVLTRIVELVDSRFPAVRRAARQSLAEFSFPRFLAAFDMLDEAVRGSTALLVRKIDPQSVPLLRAELESPMRTRRLRAIAVTAAMQLHREVAPELIVLLKDPDHMVRAAAAAALGAVPTTGARKALLEAIADRNESVQDAARKSLSELDAAMALGTARN